jgi:hypothetical protein
MSRADVYEVDVDPVDGCHELRQGIELRLRPTPVVAATLVVNQLLQLGQLGTLRSIGDGLLDDYTNGRLDKAAFESRSSLQGTRPLQLASHGRTVCGSPAPATIESHRYFFRVAGR